MLILAGPREESEETWPSESGLMEQGRLASFLTQKDFWRAKEGLILALAKTSLPFLSDKNELLDTEQS